MKASHKLADAPVVLAIALAVFLGGETVGFKIAPRNRERWSSAARRSTRLQMLPRLRMVSSLCAIRKSPPWENVARSLMGAQPGSWIAPEWL